MHVHVASADGEAKFWLEPKLELAEAHGIASHELTAVTAILNRRIEDVIASWRRHFGS
jgi:hypothetical protein